LNDHAPHVDEPDGAVTLRAVSPDDLPTFYEQQLDPAANWMAAFTGEDQGFSNARGEEVEEFVLRLEVTLPT
jgi:hypothetical protein